MIGLKAIEAIRALVRGGVMPDVNTINTLLFDAEAMLGRIAALEADAVHMRAGLREAADAAKRQTQIAEAEAAGRRDLEQRVAALESEKARLVRGNEDLATQVVDLQDRAAALESERDEWRVKWDGATQNEAKALAHVSELEKSLENARRSEEVLRKRVEAAADALADVLPGEVGRLDLLARIAELRRHRAEAMENIKATMAERDAAVANNAALKRSLEDASAVSAEVARISRENLERAITAQTERNEARADNAALLSAVNDVLNFVHCHSPDMGGNHRYSFMPKHGPAVARLQAIAAEPHPGTALLERMRRLEEVLGQIADGRLPDGAAAARIILGRH